MKPIFNLLTFSKNIQCNSTIFKKNVICLRLNKTKSVNINHETSTYYSKN